MPLRCFRDDQEVVAFDISAGEDWERLRAENAANHCLRLPCCSSGVILRTSHLGTRHFAHARREDCASAPETAEHLLAKNEIAQAVQRAGWVVAIEHSGETPAGQAWVADVMASRPGKRSVVFEVQWSRQNEEETRERQARYEAAGVSALWLMRQAAIPIDRQVPAFRLGLDLQTRTFHVQLPSATYSVFDVRGVAGDKPHLWAQSIELGRFVQGALTGKLQFAAAVGATVPLQIWAAPTQCWKCNKTTRIVTELRFELPGTGAQHDAVSTTLGELEEFLDDATRFVISLLPADLLRPYGIGAIKQRYSRQAGGSYLSNGCVHCDALQGSFYAHRVSNDATQALSVQTVVTAGLVERLPELSNAVNRWRFQ